MSDVGRAARASTARPPRTPTTTITSQARRPPPEVSDLLLTAPCRRFASARRLPAVLHCPIEAGSATGDAGPRSRHRGCLPGRAGPFVGGLLWSLRARVADGSRHFGHLGGPSRRLRCRRRLGRDGESRAERRGEDREDLGAVGIAGTGAIGADGAGCGGPGTRGRHGRCAVHSGPRQCGARGGAVERRRPPCRAGACGPGAPSGGPPDPWTAAGR